LALSTDTIAAVATGAAPAGVAIVRVSGPQALSCLQRLATLPRPLPPRQALLRRISHPLTRELLDEAVVIYYAAPASFTGEDVVEIQGHGGVRHVEMLLSAVQAAGARAAEPGEFTRRAVLNGRLSLERAEALIDLVEAETEAGLRAARSQLFGKLGLAVSRLQRLALELLAELEATLDFPDDADGPPDLRERCVLLARGTDELLATHRLGRAVREGVRVVIVGAPNVGKSSLFNALVGHERAIVDAEPGTTRDVIEAKTVIEGIACTLVDTAGLREGQSRVERLGIERTRTEAERADLLVTVIDATRPETPTAEGLLVANKCDLIPPGNSLPFQAISVSAQTGDGLEQLRRNIAQMIRGDNALLDAEVIVTSRRHAELLDKARASFEKAQTPGLPLELVAYDLRDGLDALDAILGRGVSDALLDEIFSKFCIGK